MKRQTIQERVAGVVDSRRQQLKKEIEYWEKKMEETQFCYGFGGPYRRQEEARDRRKQELAELEDFARQQGAAMRHTDARMYTLYCRSCGNIIMSFMPPYGSWHECPHCKGAIFENQPAPKSFEIVDQGQTWLELIKEGTEQ